MRPQKYLCVTPCIEISIGDETEGQHSFSGPSVLSTMEISIHGATLVDEYPSKKKQREGEHLQGHWPQKKALLLHIDLRLLLPQIWSKCTFWFKPP